MKLNKIKTHLATCMLIIFIKVTQVSDNFWQTIIFDRIINIWWTWRIHTLLHVQSVLSQSCSWLLLPGGGGSPARGVRGELKYIFTRYWFSSNTWPCGDKQLGLNTVHGKRKTHEPTCRPYPSEWLPTIVCTRHTSFNDAAGSLWEEKRGPKRRIIQAWNSIPSQSYQSIYIQWSLHHETTVQEKTWLRRPLENISYDHFPF